MLPISAAQIGIRFGVDLAGDAFRFLALGWCHRSSV
jgi:hypothetical protein